jgi:hypothetical protein
MMINFKKTGSSIVVLLLLLLTGCHSSNRKNVTVEMSNRFWDDTVYVDVACIKDDMYSQYDMCSKEKYWGTDSDLRLNLHGESFVFDIYHPTKQRLLKNNPLWSDLGNDDYLVVLVNMPKSYARVPWKMIIPLGSNYLDDDDIFIYISDKGLIRFDQELDYPNPSLISDEDMRRFIKE